MKSSDNNLNNPLKVDTIDLQREIPSWENPTICPCTQDFYDLIQTHEPNTMYIIIDKNIAYLGDMLVTDHILSPKYTVGVDANDCNKYIIYFSYPDGLSYHMEEICSFNNPIIAMDYIHIATLAGSHNTFSIKLYHMIKSYIEENINCNELILGIFTLFGYRESPDFQAMVNTITTYTHGMKSINTDVKKDKSRDIPQMLREDIRDWRDNDKNHMFVFYSSIYDVIVKYNFFSDKKYKDLDNLNLSDPIKEIIKIFIYCQ